MEAGVQIDLRDAEALQQRALRDDRLAGAGGVERALALCRPVLADELKIANGDDALQCFGLAAQEQDIAGA